jgi:hypothetical protein
MAKEIFMSLHNSPSLDAFVAGKDANPNILAHKGIGKAFQCLSLVINVEFSLTPEV